MNHYSLSIRDNGLVKNADFIQGFLGTIKDKFNLRTKPFETIFGVIGPMMPSSIIWKGILLMAEYKGYGPGRLGRLIDEYLGFGKGKKVNLSFSGVWEAAKKTIQKLFSWIGLKTKTSQQHGLVLIKTANKMPLSSRMTKEAGILAKVMSFFKGKLMSPVNWLGKLLWMFAKGLIGLGLVGGAASALGLGNKKDDTGGVGGSGDLRPVDTPIGGKQPSKPAGSQKARLQYYSNVKNDVEETLITFLDARIANFSKAFQTYKGYPLKGSKEMKQLLEDVELMNYGKDIHDLDGRKAFIARPVMQIAKFLLPKANIEKVTPAGGPKKQIDKKKVKAPDKKPTPVSNEKKLVTLLQGVL
jgi:hypothetical protein